MTNVFEYLFPCDANNGDVIIKQGDEGDNFYIIEQVRKSSLEIQMLPSKCYRVQ